MPNNIKVEIGRLMRLARDAKGMSRATLAMRLGISPKTIQSWEMGRTFIERLDLIPQLEAELECSLSSLIARATGAPQGSGNGENGGAGGRRGGGAVFDERQIGLASQQKLLTRPGPLSPRFTLASAESAANDLDAGLFEAEWVSVPMLKAGAFLNPVSAIQPRDVVRHVLIPREWAPRAGVLAAVRMGDSAMMPMIPLGAAVIVDLRPIPLEKAVGRVAALEFAGKGLRIRRVVKDMAGERHFGASVTEHGRARIQIRRDKGDRVLGGAIGVLAAMG